MKKILNKLSLLLLLCISSASIAQPLPCPPIVSTTMTAYGDTTICHGACTSIGVNYFTTIKSTSSYQFSTIPYLPTAFTGGTPILVGTDDVYSGVVPLPFPFCFYGTKYTSCLVGANGEICFNTALASGGCPWSIPGPIPTTAGSLNAATLNTIMGAYYDMDPSILSAGPSTTWAVYGSAPCRTFVVSWNSIGLFNAGTCPGLTGTQQIVLYESTYAIDIFIHNKPICTAWNSGRGSIGIVDATGANFNFAPGKNATSWASVDEGYRFTPNGPATWTFKWTDNTGAVIGTTPVITVCPSDSTTYHIEGVVSTFCNDSFKLYDDVFVDVKDPKITHTAFTNPTLCGRNDGTITLYGLVPGLIDTIFYNLNGVPQPTVIQTVLPDSSLKLSNLCIGSYDNIRVKVGVCYTNYVGPILLTAPPLTIAPATTTNPTICGACQGTLTLHGLLGSQAYVLFYNFNGTPQPPLPITTLADGTYTLTNLCDSLYDNIYLSISGPCVTSAAPCNTPVIGPYKIKSPPADTIYVDTFKRPTECGICNGSITLRPVPPYSSDTVFYSINGVAQPPVIIIANTDSAILMTGLCAGVYSNMSVKLGFCASPVIGSATLVDSPIHAQFTDVIHYGCNGDSVLFTNLSYANGATSLYSIWKFGDGTTDSITNPTHIYAQGNYTVTLISTNHHCVDSTSLPLSLFHPLNAKFVADPLLVCQNTPVVFTDSSLSNGYISHAWNFGNGATDTNMSPTYTYTNSGTYQVRLIIGDWVPCYDTAYTTIQVDTISGAQLLATDTVQCSGTHITLTGLFAGLGNTGVSWQFGNGDSILNVNPVVYAYGAAGTYTVSVTPHYRVCAEPTATKVITVVPQPGVYVGEDTAICIGSESLVVGDRFSPTYPGETWLWNTGETSRNITVVAPGLYYVTVNVNNCYASDSVRVSDDCYIDIPNVFTPNGDGVNDYFLPRQLLSKGLTSFKMNIYNRWGQLIYETASLNGRGWDGKLNSEAQPQGVYVYIIDAIFRDGQKEHHQGNVTLLR